MDIYDLSVERVANFWSKVDRSDPDSCWEWTAADDGRSGYGVFGSPGPKGTVIRAHRFAALLAYGEMPALGVLHTCDNPPCVNPNHFLVASQRNNMLDCQLKGRQSVGERHGAKLTEKVVRSIREDARPFSAIARDLGVSPSAVRNASKRITWKHVQ